MKKKNIILIASISVVLIVVFTIVLFNGSKKEEGNKYKKYSANVTIVLKKSTKDDVYHVTIKDDGENAHIMSSMVDNPSYVIGKSLYYLDKDTYFIYTGENSYRDFYGFVEDIHTKDLLREEGDYDYFSCLVETEQVNDILKSLYFKSITSSSKVAEVVKKNGKVAAFNLSLDDVEGLKSVSISATFDELNDDFVVDTSSVFGSSEGGNGIEHYDYERSDTNIFEIK